MDWSDDHRLKSAQVALAPNAYRREFEVKERDGIFYVDRPDWRRYQVSATATSAAGASHTIDAVVSAQVNRSSLFPLIWC